MSSPVAAADTDLRRRSQLFVPAHVDRFARKATSVCADAVVLDLEDSVPARERDGARDSLASRVDLLSAVPLLMVRVNAGSELEADVRACHAVAVEEVLVPKVESAGDVQRVRELCRDLGYAPRVSLLVESARGLANLGAILAVGVAATVALGVEDLRAELELHAPVPGSSEVLMHAHASLILAARAHDVTPIGLLGSIARYDDDAALSRAAVDSWRLGYRGSYCIHPKQVKALNHGFRPASKDVEWAHRVVLAEVHAADQGRGAFVVDGAMVDAPLVSRARRILAHDFPVL